MADDDFPVATAVLTVDPARVDEGNPVTATVTITTAREEMPHEGAGTIQLSTADGLAMAGSDYTAIPTADGALTFDITDFTEQDVGGDTRYQASAEVEIATRDDGEGEQDETFTVNMAAVATAPGDTPTDSAITLGTPSSQEVTIGANQRDNDANLRGVEVHGELDGRGDVRPVAVERWRDQLRGRRPLRPLADHARAGHEQQRGLVRVPRQQRQLAGRLQPAEPGGRPGGEHAAGRQDQGDRAGRHNRADLHPHDHTASPGGQHQRDR